MHLQGHRLYTKIIKTCSKIVFFYNRENNWSFTIMVDKTMVGQTVRSQGGPSSREFGFSFFVTDKWSWNGFFLMAGIVMKLLPLYAYKFVQNYLKINFETNIVGSALILTNSMIMNISGHKRKIHSFLKSNQKSLVSATREFSVLINRLKTAKWAISHQWSKLTSFQIWIVSNHSKRPWLIKNYHVMHFWNFFNFS